MKLFLSDDPNAYLREAVHGMQARYGRDFALKDVEVAWCEPYSDRWKSALCLEDVEGLTLSGFVGRQAHPDSDEPGVMLRNVVGAEIRACRAVKGTGTFLGIGGEQSKDIRLLANDFSAARRPLRTDDRNTKAIAHAGGNAGYE